MPFHRYIQAIRFQPGWPGFFISPVFFIRKELNDFIQKNAIRFQGTIADIGCGTQPYRSYFVNAKSYTGFDLPGQAGPGVIVFDGKNIPAANSSFDGVLSSEVLEHVFWPNEWLTEINRILRPGGWMLLTCPFMFHEHEAPFDYGRYASYGLQYLLEQNGFDIIVFKKAVPGLRCVLLQWNVLWWSAFKKHLPRPLAFILSWFFFFPSNVGGLLLGLAWKNTGSFYAGNLVMCQKKVNKTPDE